jgi:trk system potassium uptake protein
MVIHHKSKRERAINIFKQVGRIPFTFSILSILAFLYDFGFEHEANIREFLFYIYITAIVIGTISIVLRFIIPQYRPRRKTIPFDILLILFYIVILSFHFKGYHSNLFDLSTYNLLVYLAIFVVFFREFSALQFEFKKVALNPAQIFVLSFLSIIIAGSFLLLLPNATHTRISLIDALFTSTSAVCVTGLIVVDTGSFFTEFGQIIIAVLIQIGGLGIMTFASYFSYFFRGGSSYENQLILRDITNAEKISEVFSVLKKILIVTILIEGIGAILIFYSLDSAIVPSLGDKLFFAIFHAISGFCNAGFSTLPNSFYESAFQFNYPLHIIVATLFIIGGLGFPIVFNLFRFAKSKLKAAINLVLSRKQKIIIPRIINVNTRIVLLTSLILTVLGTVAFLILEYNNTLLEHNLFGKIVTSFFGSVTTRTAGFNTVDTSALNLHTILIVMFLMWVGASPASTGGGIKTSTLAVAILNTFSIARGKTKLEIYNREIPRTSIDRAFAIIVLSIMVISVSILLISFFDSDKGMLNISFECVSAYSTVGLSRGITSNLSSASKLILILTMFIGRVSMLTLLIALYKKVSTGSYRYPSENILIN